MSPVLMLQRIISFCSMLLLLKEFEGGELALRSRHPGPWGLWGLPSLPGVPPKLTRDGNCAACLSVLLLLRRSRSVSAVGGDVPKLAPRARGA